MFTEFKISAEKGFCQSHQNKYPVINLSLKSVRASDWDACLLHIKDVISRVYKEHKYLLKSDKLEGFEKQFIEKIILEKGVQKDYEFSLLNLSEYLSTHFGNEAILLVDEYDTPIINGYKEEYYDEVIKFMQVFMGSAFKGNPFLHKGLITGIMRIARESIFRR
ncbi:MAG: AAA family ATPase [Lewinellaceae bacterium]|nr:AAA family ATPase [Lewinellaceae bacterium]